MTPRNPRPYKITGPAPKPPTIKPRPNLSDAANELLELQWARHLAAYHLTGPHLYWHDEEWMQQARSGLFSYTDVDRKVDDIGVDQSMGLAMDRITDVFSAYRRLRLDLKTHLELIESEPDRVLAEVALVWAGGTEAHNDWWERRGWLDVAAVLKIAADREKDRALKEEIKTREREEEIKRIRAEAAASHHAAPPSLAKRGPQQASTAEAPATVDAISDVVRMAERKRLRDDYKAAWKGAGEKETDTTIGQKAYPTTAHKRGWNSRYHVQKWLRLHPRYEGEPDHRIREVLRRRPTPPA